MDPGSRATHPQKLSGRTRLPTDNPRHRIILHSADRCSESSATSSPRARDNTRLVCPRPIPCPRPRRMPALHDTWGSNSTRPGRPRKMATEGDSLCAPPHLLSSPPRCMVEHRALARIGAARGPPSRLSAPWKPGRLATASRQVLGFLPREPSRAHHTVTQHHPYLGPPASMDKPLRTRLALLERPWVRPVASIFNPRGGSFPRA